MLLLGAACSGGGGVPADPCGNAVGNGDELIAGPSVASDPFGDQVFRSLAVDPLDADTVYVGTEENGIVRSTDGGVTWTRLRQGIRHGEAYPEVYDLKVSPVDPQRLLLATTSGPGPLDSAFPSSDGGFYRSEDAGLTWQRGNCGLPNAALAAVAFDPIDPTRVLAFGYAGAVTFSGPLAGQFFPGGIYGSDDFGATWTAASVPASAETNYFPIVVERGAALFTFGIGRGTPVQNAGFLQSTDGGRTWSGFAPTLRDTLIHEFDVSVDGMTIVANEQNSFVMQVSSDGGATWVARSLGGNGPIAISPIDPDLVLFEDSGTVRRSTDGMQTATVVLGASNRFDDFEFAPSDPMVVYGATEHFDVWRSDDAGATWTLRVNLRTGLVLQ